MPVGSELVVPYMDSREYGFIAKFVDVESGERKMVGVGRSLGSDAEQIVDEARLGSNVSLAHPSHSSLMNHVYGFDTFQGSPCTLKRTVALG
jgi:hypothetical protein